MRLPQELVKDVIRKSTRKLGYDIVRQDRFGNHPFLDIVTLLGDGEPVTIFDVGANEGQTALDFARHFPRGVIHCFEPYPDAYDKLRRTVASFPRCTPHNLALGERDGIAKLFLNRASVTNSLLANSPGISNFAPKGWTEPVGSIDVPVRRLDTFCIESNIDRIDVLKIDTQGYEMKILEGASDFLDPATIRLVYSEVLFGPYYEGQAYFEDVYLKLKAKGYKFVDLYNRALNSDKSLMWADALFI